ncbi:MAG: peptide deformylase [Patescibacteria group bacterium]|nr:peptide deformylase [Patescibacteria group bacterium]
MSKLEIIKEPNPILRQKSVKIKAITPEVERLILDMAKTMKANNGVGLAAPQVGHSLRLFVINNGDSAMALINPKILWRSFGKETEEEGCLSCPGVWGEVKRSKSVWVLTRNKNGKYNFFKASGLFARVIQHEYDHLNGVLIIDKISTSVKAMADFEKEKR